MTYKELIDTLTTIIEDHRLINQWGYGNLSDIETPETGAPNYPYMFINPVQVLIQSYGFDVTLNLITMDQPLEGVEQEIDAASRTLGLIQDIIAKFKLTTLYSETDVTLSVQCTPFKERFKDSVIGNTAVITFQIEEPLDVCTDVAPKYEFYIQRRANVVTTFDFDGVPEGNEQFIRLYEYSLDGSTWVINPSFVKGSGYRTFIPSETGAYKIDFDLDIKFNAPEDGSGQLKYGVGIEVPGTGPSGAIWNSQRIDQPWVSNDTVVNLTASYEGTLQAGLEYYFFLTQYYASVPLGDIGYQQIGSNMTISKAK